MRTTEGFYDLQLKAFNFLRRLYMPLLQTTAMDFRIQHHWVPGRKIALNSFKHKGYWYHGKRRERRSMELFARLIKPGMTIVEVGGHIGYMSVYFEHLASPSGRVIVFEPGSNNLPYIRKTVSDIFAITLEEKGVGKQDGYLDFFEESLTGQNNSFVENFDGLAENREVSYVNVNVTPRKVELVSLDSYCNGLTPDFIKIDVEGFEYDVLLGASDTLKKKPRIMVEVQKNQAAIFKLLQSAGYRLFDDQGHEARDEINSVTNIFCLHSVAHVADIENAFRDQTS
jgi:FkbM family methyltransferase